MNGSFNPIEESVVWVADTGLFVACGRQQNNKYTALERFAQRNDLSFVIPQRVYDELGGAPNRSTPGQTLSTARLTQDGLRSPRNPTIRTALWHG